jgi:hypothetical protein
MTVNHNRKTFIVKATEFLQKIVFTDEEKKGEVDTWVASSKTLLDLDMMISNLNSISGFTCFKMKKAVPFL